MKEVLIVGSGASGVHFALSLLRKNYRVVMVDIGNRKPAPVRPDADFVALREMEDPAGYFLGGKYEALILPGNDGEYYGFPPNKQYIFAEPRTFAHQARGFSPLFSFAAGGLAEAWTGGCYPFHDGDLEGFPFDYGRLGPCYSEVARRIGISGAEDDLARFFPVHEGLMDPLELDEHSGVFLQNYARHRRELNEKLRFYIGRARLATLSRNWNGRPKCDYSGRCLWGCPAGSLYTPSLTLEECRRYPNFHYENNLSVSHFCYNSAGDVTRLVAYSTRDQQRRDFPVSRLALAAGALCSSKIFLESIYRDTGTIATLPGLMDNRQVLMPFVNLRMLGHAYNPRSYQYHQIAIGMEGESPKDYVHGLVTTLKTAMIHPVVQSLPFDLGTSVALFRNLHAALGLVNINFSDWRREENYVSLDPHPRPGESRLVIHYAPEAGEEKKIKRATKTFQRGLRKLSCVAPGAMLHRRPMGASVHYAGTIPMLESGSSFTCTPSGQSRDFRNLYLVDGTTFPALPAKNLTFSLMANAVRIAEEAF